MPSLSQQAIKRRGLRYRAWEAIEDETLARVGRFDPLCDDFDDHVVGYQRAARHDLLRLQTYGRARGDRRAEHVTGRELD
jgi:hypothetical protein